MISIIMTKKIDHKMYKQIVVFDATITIMCAYFWIFPWNRNLEAALGYLCEMQYTLKWWDYSQKYW